MDRIIARLGMLPDPQPPPLGRHPESGLIPAHPFALGDLVENGGHTRLRMAIRLCQNILQAALCDGKSKQILTDLGQAVIGQQVNHVQGYQEPVRPGPDVDRRRPLVRKLPLVPVAPGTHFREGLRFDHRHLKRWNLSNLTPSRHLAGRRQ
jgi:hypothetical protein